MGTEPTSDWRRKRRHTVRLNRARLSGVSLSRYPERAVFTTDIPGRQRPDRPWFDWVEIRIATSRKPAVSQPLSRGCAGVYRRLLLEHLCAARVNARFELRSNLLIQVPIQNVTPNVPAFGVGCEKVLVPFDRHAPVAIDAAAAESQVELLLVVSVCDRGQRPRLHRHLLHVR
jgi:hypothetical protein